MTHWKKYLIGIVSLVALVVMLGSGAVALAQEEGQGRRGERGPRGGAGGEVTAVSDSSLTVLNRNDESITVNVSAEIEVHLVESQSEGSLSDIEVGDRVKVRGQRNEDGSVEARRIAVMPEGDHLGGRVTGVDGSTISVENRDGAATITVSDSTTFRTRSGEASLSDITDESHVKAFGELQEDGSLSARLVMIGEGKGSGPDGRPGPRPERSADGQ